MIGESIVIIMDLFRFFWSKNEGVTGDFMWLTEIFFIVLHHSKILSSIGLDYFFSSIGNVLCRNSKCYLKSICIKSGISFFQIYVSDESWESVSFSMFI